MGKPKRKDLANKKAPQYGSDDERAYAKEKVPDRNEKDFFEDDIDDFHNNREKILLDKGASLEPAGFSSDEQEGVLDIGASSDDSSDEEIKEYEESLRRLRRLKAKDDMASDLEDENEGALDSRAWGQSKEDYYGTDITEEVHLDLSDEEGNAQLEEQEALELQKQMAEQLDEDDFGLENFRAEKKVEDQKEGEEKIVKDLTKMSKKEKMELLKKESPELLELIEDFKIKLSQVKAKWLPLDSVVKSGQIPAGPGADYIQAKLQLHLNYCVNVNFYLMLKAKRTAVHNHPIIKRIVQYRNLLKMMGPLDKLMEDQVEEILEKVKKGESLNLVQNGVSKKSAYKKTTKEKKAETSNKKKLSDLLVESGDEGDEEEDAVAMPTQGRKRKRKDASAETKEERIALEYYSMMKAAKRGKAGQDEEDEDKEGMQEQEEYEEGAGEEEMEGEEEEDGGKRGITRQIEKNKGLTPHRKKEQRNPRVKHRNKYRKALIRRKGQVREVRHEVQKYGGEISGIRAGIKRGIKFK